jgi:pimeloyl-ACP methyl ester carboxylesterase
LVDEVTPAPRLNGIAADTPPRHNVPMRSATGSVKVRGLDTSAPTACWVHVQGQRLEVLHIPAHAPARVILVFLHEGLGSVSMWRDWPARVCAATGCAGWVVSRRGYGQSEPILDVRGAGRLQADYMHQEAYSVLPALLSALHIQRPVLVGHSDGGSIALLHASRFAVAGCVVMAPHIVVEDISIAAIEQAKIAYELGDLRQRLARHHADPDSAFWQWNDVWLSDAFRGFDIQAECRRIRAPLLCVQGEDDPYGTMRQIDEIAPAGRKQQLKLPHCGHAPYKDQPEAVTQAIVAFLRGL